MDYDSSWFSSVRKGDRGWLCSPAGINPEPVRARAEKIDAAKQALADRARKINSGTATVLNGVKSGFVVAAAYGQSEHVALRSEWTTARARRDLAISPRPRDLRHQADLEEPVITTFGRDFAVANRESDRAGSDILGMQSQTWVRMPQGWRIVSAHVSELPARK